MMGLGQFQCNSVRYLLLIMWIRIFLLVILLSIGEMVSASCPSNSFQCGTGNCVPMAWRCDMDEDCLDGSDELNCQVKNCTAAEFRCGDGRCIPQRWACDGDQDCSDGADEKDCGGVSTAACKGNEFQCKSSGRCIHQAWVCDGDVDCHDGSDENCDNTCRPDEFQCPDEQLCVASSRLCDGNNDCKNGSDELNCSDGTCRPDEFQCPGEQLCVATSRLCDGNNDCTDGSDELNCSNGTCRPDEFQCPDEQLCVATSRLCDGNNDCTDGSDELNCRGRPVLLLANRGDLRSVSLDGSTVKVLLNGSKVGLVSSVDFVHAENKIYWTDLLLTKILRADLDDMKSLEIVVTHTVQTPDGLAVDWINKHIYWTDTGFDWISVASLDGTMRKTLIDTGLDQPRAITVDPIMDYAATRLYWIDAKRYTIESANLDGTQRVTVLKSDRYLKHPFAITVFEDYLYWTDWSSQSIKKYSKLGQGDIETVTSNLTHPVGIQAFHLNRQPVIREFCGDNNGGCSHFCFPKPLNNTATYKPGSSHYTCDCPNGFVLQADGRTCTDGDVTCRPDQFQCPDEQLCVATSLLCDGNNDCTNGSDELNCKGKGPNPKLFIATRKELRSISLDGRTSKVLLTGSSVGSAVAVDFLYTDNKLYWTDITFSKIVRADLDDMKSVEVVAKENISTPDGLAVDWINRHIYWTDTFWDWICVASLEGSLRKTLIDTELDEPRAIAVDPNNGYIYWSDWGTAPKIERCGMNGDKREIIVQTNITWPNGLTIDYAANKLYWVDAKFRTIENANLDGTQRVTVLQSSGYLQHPFAITVFKDYLYWTEWTSSSIMKYNKFGNAVTGKIISFGYKPNDIQAFHPSRQPVIREFCGNNNGGCSHFCFPKPLNNTATYKPGSNHYTCDCPNGFVLQADGRTCTDSDVTCLPDQFKCSDELRCVATSLLCDGNNDCTNGSDEFNCKGDGQIPKLIFAVQNELQSISLDNRTRKVLLNGSRVGSAVAVDFLYTDNKLYWTDIMRTSSKISRLDLNDMKTVEVIVNQNISSPEGLAVDWINKHIYWTDTNFDWICVASLDGTMRKTLIDTGLDQPRAIAVDPNNGYIYWTDWGRAPRIERCGMNGDKREIVVQTNITVPNGLTIDYAANRLYWTDARFDTIESANLDGTQRVTVLQSDQYLRHPFAVTVLEDYLYWTDWLSRSILKRNKFGHGDTEQIISSSRYSPMGIQAFHPSRQPVIKEFCGDNNGGCSHFCFPKPLNNTATYKPGSNHYTCDCPNGFVLQADGRTCTDETRASSSVSSISSSTTVSATNSILTTVSTARSSSPTKGSSSVSSTVTSSMRSSTISSTRKSSSTSKRRSPIMTSSLRSHTSTFTTTSAFTPYSVDSSSVTTQKRQGHAISPTPLLNPVIVGLIVIGMVILVVSLLALFGFLLYRITKRKRTGHATITYNAPASASGSGRPQDTDEPHLTDHENGTVNMEVNLLNN